MNIKWNESESTSFNDFLFVFFVLTEAKITLFVSNCGADGILTKKNPKKQKKTKSQHKLRRSFLINTFSSISH